MHDHTHHKFNANEVSFSFYVSLSEGGFTRVPRNIDRVHIKCSPSEISKEHP